MTSLGRVLAAAAAVTLIAAPAYAQRIQSNAQGTFGTVNLVSGFTPDPHVTTVNAGGPIDVSTVSDNCRGFIAERPSFTLNFRKGELPLYIGVAADDDAKIELAESMAQSRGLEQTILNVIDRNGSFLRQRIGGA